MSEPQVKSEDTQTLPRPFPWHCPKCRRKEVRAAVVPYRCEMAHDGCMHAVEVSGLSVPRCDHCGELVFNDPAEEQIRQRLRAQLRLLAPEDIRAARMNLGLSQKDLADRLGAAEATISRWETGAQIQSRAMDNLLRVFFALPEVRSVLLGAKQNPHLGIETLFDRADR
jgi:putative zinc finger/helix-turn-helix YgiT family protein